MRKTIIVKKKEVAEFGNIDFNVDAGKLTPTTIRVQDTILKPVICKELFEYILDLIDLEDSGTPLNADYDILVNYYVKPFLITEIEKKFIVVNSNKITAKGTGKMNDEYQRANEIPQSKILIDDINKSSTSYRNSLIEFLEDNKETYPLYKECNCDEVGKQGSSYSNALSFL